MNRTISTLGAVALVTTLSGCVIVGGDGDMDWEDWRHEQRENQAVISDLELGIARELVVDRLGTPAFSEAFTEDGHEYRVLFYRTQHRHSDGETSKDETTPLVFQDEQLIGWGESILADIRP